ncbi:heme peroxidase [Polychytrium aggregatum]|uniref:heme peroxidase n=1 Tax=Polychytrium aggregatum TaxID=110093 RepID=UPI0022FE0F9A|nr:heme peroxidase [Polychytrium aggregatum]KAI9197110.1 heme peroxidase [Polychytrium aggregatum]
MRRARVDSLVHLLLLCTIGLTVNAVTIPYDGVGNNQLYPQRGAAESPYLRLMAPAYAGTHAEPSGPNRPNPRIVSNALFHYGSSTISPEGRSDWIGVWGLYIHLDTTLADRNASESCAINVPTGDTVFDPHSQGGYQIPMIRTSVIPNSTDPRQAGSRVLSNGFSSYLDASGIYGVNSQSQSLVRLFRGGLLRTQIDPVAGEIPIYVRMIA